MTITCRNDEDLTTGKTEQAGQRRESAEKRGIMTYTIHWIFQAELSDMSRIIKDDLTVEIEDQEYLDEINTELLKMPNIAAYDWNGLHKRGKSKPQQALSMEKITFGSDARPNDVKRMISHFSKHDFKGTQPGIAHVNTAGHEQ